MKTVLLNRYASRLAALMPFSVLEFIYTRVLKPSPLRTMVNAFLSSIIPEKISVHGAWVALNRSDPVVSGAIALGVYEKLESQLFLRALRKGMVVIDIGANVGLYTSIAAKTVGASGRVIAFEPDSQNYSYLRKTVQINGFTNVTPLRCAVSNTTSEILLYKSEGHMGDHRTYDTGEGRERTLVHALRLDEYLQREHLRRVDIIKMDIQGSEGFALDGMLGTLEQNADIRLFTEFWPQGLEKSGYSPIEFLTKLQRLGFRIEEISFKHNSKLPVSDFNQLIEKTHGRTYTNLFCVRDRS